MIRKSNLELAVCILGDKEKLLNLQDCEIVDLPVKILECSTYEEAFKVNEEYHVVLIVADIESLGEVVAENIANIQLKGYSDTQIIVVMGENISSKDLSLIEDNAFVDIFHEPVKARRFRNKVLRLVDRHERQKELAVALKELSGTKKRLEATDRKVKILTSTVSDPIMFVDQNLMVSFWNSEAESLFGYTKFEVINESFLRWLVAPKSQSEIITLFEALKKSGAGILKREQKFTFRNKLGVEIDVHTTLSFHKLDQDSFNLVFVVHDKVQERKLEKETLRARELREENKLMREVLNHVSHEIRTSLNSIVGISKTILGHNASNLSERQYEGVGLVQKSGEQLLGLIKNLMSISRMEANKMELNVDYFDFERLLSQQKSQALNLIGKKNIRFVIKTSPAIPTTIQGDAFKINQILTNVLGNAVKYTPEGKVVLSSHLIGNKLYFEVSDTGVGISKEQQRTIFDKFSRGGDASKHSPGSGLGLHLTKKLVELMNGEISFESRKGGGTIFRFFVSLPAEVKPLSKVFRREEIESDDLRVLNYAPTRKLIMAIDDSIENTFIYSILSEQEQYSVLICNNSKHALSIASSFAPDLLLVKLELPHVHGASIIKELKRRGAVTPIIAFSEYDKNQMDLPVGTTLLDEPVSLGALFPLIQNEVEWQEKEKVKGVLIVEEDKWFAEEHEEGKSFLEIENTHEELSQIKIGQREIEYLIIENADKNSNALSLFLNILSEGNIGRFKQIVLHYEATPVKFLIDKVSSLNNVALLNKKEMLQLKFSK